MEHFHAMVIQDEIVLCGVVLLLGFVTGAVARLVAVFGKRRAA